MKTCAKCNKEIIRTPRANNVKYCAECRKEAYKYTEYRTNWQRVRRDSVASRPRFGQKKCLLCGKYYNKPLSHAWQVHQVNEREYKAMHGLDHKKGIVAEQTREILREHVKANYDLVVARNLLKGGKKSRFTKGHTINYTRSPQTMERLKLLHKYKKNI